MYLFITRNSPFFSELNKDQQGEGLQKDLDNIEIELKNKGKEKVDESVDSSEKKGKNGSTIYDSDEEGLNRDLDEDTALVRLKGDEIQGDNQRNQESINRKKKLYKHKFFIHLTNIITSILLIAAGVFSFIEDEEFRKHNKYIRNVASLIISAIHERKYNHTWDGYIFNDTRINLYDAIDNRCETVSTLCYNNEEFENSIYMNNSEFLKLHNFTPNTFGYSNGMKNYRNIELNLELSDLSKNLRIIILILNLVGMIGIVLGKYLLYLFEYIFIHDKNTPFYKSKYFGVGTLEFIHTCLFQYPAMTAHILVNQGSDVFYLPLSTILSSISMFKIFYIARIINALLIYDSAKVDDIFIKYSKRPSFFFTFKVIQKRYPFLTVTVLFIMSLISLSLFMRVYEIHYWEGQVAKVEDWEYYYNSIWVIFSSMMTIGYGDLYPRTHCGRIVLVISCFLGIYFMSIIMIYTNKYSVLKECESKSYKLITRLKLRSELKDINADMIYHFLIMITVKNKYDKRKLNENEYLVKENFERRTISKIIEQNKQLNEKFKAFNFIPTKEQLYDISERLTYDLEEVSEVSKSLFRNNKFLEYYLNSQTHLIRYLEKSIYNTQLIYDIIEKKPHIFGELKKVKKSDMKNEVEKSRKSEFYIPTSLDERRLFFEKPIIVGRLRQSRVDALEIQKYKRKNSKDIFRGSQKFDSKKAESKVRKVDEIFADELNKYRVDQSVYLDHFKSLFFSLKKSGTKIDYKDNYKGLCTELEKMQQFAYEIENIKNTNSLDN